jgi:membrane protease subunit HflC
MTRNQARDVKMLRRTGRAGKVAGVAVVAIVIAMLVAWMVTFKVEFTEHVLVQTFGKTTAVLNGATDAGLHLRWPFVQKVVRYDGRTFVFEDAMHELSTKDKQNITLTTFCAWRIAEPRKFQTAIGTVDAGREGIRTKIRSAKSAVIGAHNMDQLVNTDPAKMRIADVEGEILETVRAEARRDYGVEVSLVRVRNLGLPEPVSNRVIEAMKSERQKEVGRYEAAGQAQATAIRERARAATEQILAFAGRKAGEIRTEGIRASAKLYKQFEKNWQLGAYLRSLESLEKELTGRTVILLDGSEIPAVRYFRDGPSLPTTAPAALPEAGPPPAKKTQAP